MTTKAIFVRRLARPGVALAERIVLTQFFSPVASRGHTGAPIFRQRTYVRAAAFAIVDGNGIPAAERIELRRCVRKAAQALSLRLLGFAKQVR